MPPTNLELAERWMDEVWNKRIESTIDDMLAPAFVGHSEGHPDLHGPTEFRAYRSALLSALPDLRIAIEDAIGSGDDVAVRWRVHGARDESGEGAAAVGKPVEFWGMTWMRFSGGRFVEGWDAWNEEGLLQRLQTK